MRAVLALLALALAGCGYRTGFTLPESRTVGVAVFGNTSKQRDVERELHAYLTDSVQRMIDAPLVSPATADFVIEGTVTEYEHRGGIRSKDNVRLENGVRVSVVARLVRRAPVAPAAAGTGPDVLRQVPVTDERGFLIEDPLGEASARALVLRHVAERVLMDLFADMALEPQSVP